MEPTSLALDAAVATGLLDDLPLWSAPFGLRLLDAVRLRPGLVALDVGCGAGFPLVELAERLGPTARVHGVDPWAAALSRAWQKLGARGVGNVTLHEARAERLPLPDRSVDLIVSNNGLSNVEDIDAAVAECARVARPGAQLVHAWNLPGTMRELYEVYDGLLAELGLAEERQALAGHIARKRPTVVATRELLERRGFRVAGVVEESFSLRYVDAAAMLASSLIGVGFAPAWREIIRVEAREEFFAEIADRLDAGGGGGVLLSVPFACVDAARAG